MYTKEKWKTGKEGLSDMLIVPNCDVIQAPGNSLEECAANAERICHCVNNFDTLKAQRDELLAAAKRVIEDYDDRDSHIVTAGSIGRLERAIANCKKEC